MNGFPGDRLLLLEKLPPGSGSCGLPQPQAGKAGFPSLKVPGAQHNSPLPLTPQHPPSSLWAGPLSGAGDTSVTWTHPLPGPLCDKAQRSGRGILEGEIHGPELRGQRPHPPRGGRGPQKGVSGQGDGPLSAWLLRGSHQSTHKRVAKP